MSKQSQSPKYEENYAILEKITESLNKDEIGIDDLVEKTREALDAARICMDILNKQKGEFKKLEHEFSQLLKNNQDSDDNPPQQSDSSSIPDEVEEGDDPF